MSQEPRREFRKTKRVHRRQAAWVVLDGGGTQLPCVLWDLSEGGARIAAARASALPDAFELFLTKDGKSRRFCRVAWRRGGYLGVAFVNDASADTHLAPRPARTPASPADLPVLASRARLQDIDTGKLVLPAYGTDLALDDDVPLFKWSALARMMLYMLVAATGVFILAGIEYQADWSAAICAKAENFCRHPEWTGGAAVAMLLIYLAANGMED